MTTQHIVCIGDSITVGLNVEHAAYPSQLQELLSSSHAVTNLGVSGCTACSTGLFAQPYRHHPQWQDALGCVTPDICIFMLGTNDAHKELYNDADFLPAFKAEYSEMLEVLKTKYRRLIVLTPPPCLNDNGDHRSDVLKQWANLIPELANGLDIEVINLFNLFEELGAKTSLADYYMDNVHLTEKGYKVIADTLRDILQSSDSSSAFSEGPQSDFEMRGVKIKAVRAIAARAKQIGGDWTVGRISNVLLGSHEIMKEGHRWGADVDKADTLTFADQMSLIDVLKMHHKDASNPHPMLGICYDEVVGTQATLFCSFAYNGDFFALVDSLEALILANPEYENEYFWFDMLVNNQWVAMDLDHDFMWWSNTFKTAVKKIGHMILICSPWSDPAPLKRAWCLWEIFCTIESGSKFDVALSSKDHDAFMKAILGDPGEYNKMLSNINVENSSCYLAEDKENIFKAIRESVGFTTLNAMVSSKMREWVRSAIEGSINMDSTHTPRKEQWEKMISKGCMLRDMGKYDEALAVFQKCLIEFADLHDEEQVLLSATFVYLGQVHKQRGELAQAMEFYQKALRIKVQSLGPDHPNVANTYSNIGNLHEQRGEFAQAMEFQQNALRIKVQSLGPDHKDVAIICASIGNVHEQQGEYALAIKCHQNALRIQLHSIGPDHENVAITYNNMGQIHAKLGEHPQAMEFYQKALRINVQSLGPDHPNVANTYNNMADLHALQEEYVQAMELHQKALRIQLQSLRSDHPDVAITYNNMGNVYASQEEYVQAMEIYQKALRILLQSLRSDHPDVAITYAGMADVRVSQGKYKQAIKFYENALRIQLQSLRSDHPHVGHTYASMGRVYATLQEYIKAVDFFQNALRILSQSVGPDHPDVATTNYNMGVVFARQEKFEQAKQCFEVAYDIRLRANGEDNPDTQAAKKLIKWAREEL